MNGLRRDRKVIALKMAALARTRPDLYHGVTKSIAIYRVKSIISRLLQGFFLLKVR